MFIQDLVCQQPHGSGTQDNKLTETATRERRPEPVTSSVLDKVV